MDYLPTMCEALDSMPTTSKRNKSTKGKNEESLREDGQLNYSMKIQKERGKLREVFKLVRSRGTDIEVSSMR